MSATLYLDDMQKTVSDWHKKRFPEFYELDHFRRVQTLCMKLGEETGEVLAGFNKGTTQGKLAGEAMDCIIVALQIIDELGQNAEITFDNMMLKNNKRLEL